jgi:hypothetical protein
MSLIQPTCSPRFTNQVWTELQRYEEKHANPQGIHAMSQVSCEVLKFFMANCDDDSAIYGLPMARFLERTITQCTLQDKQNAGTVAAVTLLQDCAKLSGEIVTDHQNLIDARRKHDIDFSRRPETVERGWESLINNKANLDEFNQPHGDNTYLETRRIFLPQGATLILNFWRVELQMFISQLERVSAFLPAVLGVWG